MTMGVLSGYILVYDVEDVDESVGVELCYPYDIDGYSYGVLLCSRDVLSSHNA